MQYDRGSRHDYDRWRDLGNEGWSYRDILPYFKKSENQQESKFAKDGTEHIHKYLTCVMSSFKCIGIK